MTASLRHAVRDRLRPEADRADGGFTMVEMIVTISVLFVFMGLFIGAVLQMTSATAKQQDLSETQTQVNLAFTRLDAQVRYSEYVSTPGRNGDDWYVEIYSNALAAKPRQCTQIRLVAATDRLEQRTWTSTGGAAVPTPWLLLAARVANDPTTQVPFVLLPATADLKPRLTVDVLATKGGTQSSKSTSETRITYTVSNYSASASYTSPPCSAKEVARS